VRAGNHQGFMQRVRIPVGRPLARVSRTLDEPGKFSAVGRHVFEEAGADALVLQSPPVELRTCPRLIHLFTRAD
jgi:hypothetical protein